MKKVFSGRLLQRVLLRVLPVAALALLLIGYQTQKYVEGNLLSQVQADLDKDARFAALTVSSRLHTIATSVGHVAANNLIANALVDGDARAAYLPLFFRHLQIAGLESEVDIRFTDYRGRLIASNGSKAGFPYAAWYSEVIEKGIPHFGADGLGAHFAAPVRYEGLTEGVISVVIGREQFSRALAMGLGGRLVIVRDSQYEYFSSDQMTSASFAQGPAQGGKWLSAKVAVPGYDGMVVLVAERSEHALAPVNNMVSALAVALALGLLALAGGVWSTAFLTTQPLAEFTQRLARFGVEQDLRQRLEVKGASEFQDLADSFNEMMERLQKTLVSNDRLTRENEIRLRAEQQLRDKEARTQAILDTVLEGIITIDADGTIEAFNPAAAEIFGYAATETLGRNVNMLMPEPYRSAHDGYLKRYLETGEARVIGIDREVHGMRKNGDCFPMELSVSPMMVGGKKMFTGVVRDLSERKAAEHEIEAGRNRLIDAIESLPDGFALYDSNDRLVICNERYRALYDLSKDVAQPGAAFIDVLRDGLAKGVYLDAVGREEDWFEERKRRHAMSEGPIEQRLANGRWLRVLERRTSDGGTVGIRVDITERKEREAQLAASESRLRATISASLDCVVGLDANGCITEFNPAAVDTFGYTRAEALGRPMGELLLSDACRPVLEKGIGEYLSCGESDSLGRRIEAEGRKSNGAAVPIELALSPTSGATGLGFVAFIRDVTERRRNERLKDEFISVISHELRTPLTSLSGALRLVCSGTLGEIPDKARSMLDIAHRNTGRLTVLVNDILDVEKIQSGRMEFNFTPTEVVAMATRVIEDNQAYGMQYDVGIRLDQRVGEAYADIDEGRIMQVLANLLSNAIKFSPPKSDVVLNIERVAGAVRFTVIDKGPGIPLDKQAHLFDRFYQVDASDRRSKQGTGLGLTIVKSIVEQHGSRVAVHSNVGEGATFQFDLVEVSAPVDEQEAMPRHKAAS